MRLRQTPQFTKASDNHERVMENHDHAQAADDSTAPRPGRKIDDRCHRRKGKGEYDQFRKERETGIGRSLALPRLRGNTHRAGKGIGQPGYNDDG